MTFPPEEYRLIPLTHDQFAKVSPEDFDWLSTWKWYAHWSANGSAYYASRGIGGGGGITILMHRQILNLWPGDKRQGDHINTNTLDNRRSNLRIASASENRRNAVRRQGNKSGYKGVHWCNTTQRWIAKLTLHGKSIYLGAFLDPEDAHKAYCAGATKHHGEFARFA